jgi:hypothetical protein
MSDALHTIIDVTIAYPHGKPTFADLFANRVPEVCVTVRERQIPAELIGGDYENDPHARSRVQTWINEVWSEKDEAIAKALAAEDVSNARQKSA